jgi:hypothetical protein
MQQSTKLWIGSTWSMCTSLDWRERRKAADQRVSCVVRLKLTCFFWGPWNSCGAFMAATLGVPTFSYLPYTVFNIASPLIAMAMAFAGIRMLSAPGQRPECRPWSNPALGDT